MNYEALAKLAAGLGTTDISIVSDIERGWYGSASHIFQITVAWPAD